MTKGNFWISGWHSVTPQRLECKTARRQTFYSWFDHYCSPFSESFIFSKHVIQTELCDFPRHLGKVKARRFQIYSIYWKVDYINIAAVWRLFSSKTVAALSSKPFSVTDITEFSTEAKDTCICINQRRIGNFIDTGVKRNFWLHAMCACTEWLSTCQNRLENLWLGLRV